MWPPREWPTRFTLLPNASRTAIGIFDVLSNSETIAGAIPVFGKNFRRLGFAGRWAPQRLSDDFDKSSGI
jgi:hypothetical protein